MKYVLNIKIINKCNMWYALILFNKDLIKCTLMFNTKNDLKREMKNKYNKKYDLIFI